MKSLFPIIVIILCVSVYFMYISPQIAHINELRAQLAEYQNTLNETKDLKVKRDALLASYGSISSDDTAKLKKIIPENFDSVSLVSDINSIASKNGMVLKNVKISEQKTDETNSPAGAPVAVGYKTASLNFGVSGSYSQFNGFVKDLESSLKLLDVKSVTLKESQKPGVDIYDYSFDVNTYFLR